MPQVKIRIETGVQTAGDGLEQQEQKQKQTESKQYAMVSFFAHQVASTAKQALNTQVSTIGIDTGDYLEQKKIENIVSAVEWGVSTAGAFATNVYVGLAKLAVDGFNLVSQAVVGQKKYRRQRENEEMMLRRSGNTLTNGSRTGD